MLEPCVGARVERVGGARADGAAVQYMSCHGGRSRVAAAAACAVQPCPTLPVVSARCERLSCRLCPASRSARRVALPGESLCPSVPPVRVPLPPASVPCAPVPYAGLCQRTIRASHQPATSAAAVASASQRRIVPRPRPTSGASPPPSARWPTRAATRARRPAACPCRAGSVRRARAVTRPLGSVRVGREPPGYDTARRSGSLRPAARRSGRATCRARRRRSRLEILEATACRLMPLLIDRSCSLAESSAFDAVPPIEAPQLIRHRSFVADPASPRIHRTLSKPLAVRIRRSSSARPYSFVHRTSPRTSLIDTRSLTGAKRSRSHFIVSYRTKHRIIAAAHATSQLMA
jgi:hypothetical protein